MLRSQSAVAQIALMSAHAEELRNSQ